MIDCASAASHRVRASRLAWTWSRAPRPRSSSGWGIGVEPRVGGQLLDPLGDVAGQVAEPVQIAVDLQHRGHPPQVGGHRLVQRQHPDALALDLDLPPVDLALLPLDLVGLLDPAVAQGVHAAIERVLDDRGEFQHVGPEALQVTQETATHRYPPVVPVGIAALPCLTHRFIPVAFRIRPRGRAPSPGHIPLAPLLKSVPSLQLIRFGPPGTTLNLQIHENFTMIGERT